MEVSQSRSGIIRKPWQKYIDCRNRKTMPILRMKKPLTRGVPRDFSA
jgi:hypothetical protein